MSNKKKIKVKKEKKKEEVDSLTLTVRESLGSMGRSVNLAQEKMLVKIYKLFIVGGVSTLIDFVLYLILCLVTKLDPMIVNAISFVVSFGYGLWSSYKYVFSSKNKESSFTEYLILSFTGFIVTEALLFGFVSMLSWNAIIVKLLAIILVIVCKVLMKKLIFQRKK